MDIAVGGAAVSLALDGDGTITEAHVSLGAVAPTTLLVAASNCQPLEIFFTAAAIRAAASFRSSS